MGTLRRDQQDPLYDIENVSSSVSPAEMFKTYYVDTTGGDVPIELPDTTSGNNEGIVKIFKVAGTNNVIVTTVGGTQNVGDAPTQTITELDKGLTVQSNNTASKYQITQDNRFGVTSTEVGFDFYLSDTASDIGTYFDMFSAPTGEAESTDVTSTLGIANDQLLNVWATEPTEPSFIVLTTGTFTGHVHAERTAGTRAVNIYWELYKRASGGAETLLMTSSVSSAITSKTELSLSATLASEETLLSDDRLVTKWYANVSGGGSDVDVTLYMEGANNSRMIVLTTTAALDDRYLVKGGLAGGQSASGGTASGEDLTLGSTSHATKGQVQVATGDNFGFVDDAIFMDSIKDEDTLSSDSATALATQQSIKKYVDDSILTKDTFLELTDTISSYNVGRIPFEGATDILDNAAFTYTVGTGVIGVGGITLGATTNVTGILDEDNMVSDSATDLATQQSIKKYVDDSIPSVPTLASGTYTPTLTSGLNIASKSLDGANYIRVGNIVTVGVQITIDTTSASSASTLKISLPIASNIGAASDLMGTAAASTDEFMSGSVSGDLGADEALLFFYSDTGATSQLWGITFQYEII